MEEVFGANLLLNTVTLLTLAFQKPMGYNRCILSPADKAMEEVFGAKHTLP